MESPEPDLAPASRREVLAPPPPKRLSLSTRTAIRVFVPGLYAWLVTVALPAAHREAGWLPRVLSVCALAALVGGPVLSLRRQALGRGVGVYAFVGFSLLTWLLLGDLLSMERLDPVRAALGSVGWALFAFGWGSVREVGTVPERDPHALLGAPLAARATLPPGAGVVLTIGLLGALVPIVLAWRIERPLHALLGHAVAVVAAIALVTAAAQIGVSRGNTKQHPPRFRLEQGSRALGFAVVLLGLGFIASMLW